MPVPKYDELMNPLLEAMRKLGGSSSVEEQEDAVAEILKLSEKDISEIHRGSTTKLKYRLAWARNYLKRAGYLDNSARGVWTLTPEGLKHRQVDKEELKRAVRRLDKLAAKQDEGEADDERSSWQDELLEVVKSIAPDAFERLCQRLLRESGFIQVEITGRTGDGGIDGKGVVKLGGLLSFHVIFQSKRYKGSVGAAIVRDFRGAMVGRADKGLIISTGTFTRDARLEAQRDGASPIDLIDGQELAHKLKHFGMGVQIEQRVVETVTVQRSWFEAV